MEEKDLKDLLSEDNKKSIINIPLSIGVIVKNYQDARKLRFGTRCSKHDAIIEMLAIGKDGIIDKTKKLKKEYSEFFNK